MKVEYKHTIDGEKVSEQEFLRRSRARKKTGTPNLSRSNHWRKHESVALACQASQAKEFNELAKKAGITGVHYRESDGMCEITGGRAQMKMELRNRGIYNKDDYS